MRDPWQIARTGGALATNGQPHLPRRVQGIQLLAQWKQAQEGDNAWLCRVVATGFQKLVAMALPGQPAAEMLPITGEMWVDVLLDMKMNEEQDRERIETGFRYLYRTVDEWPAIKLLLKEMPKRRAAGTGDQGSGKAVDSADHRSPITVHRERTAAEETLAKESLSEIQRRFKEKI
jgi:hypothetical protein